MTGLTCILASKFLKSIDTNLIAAVAGMGQYWLTCVHHFGQNI